MTREEVEELRQTDIVEILIGPMKGEIAVVVKTEMVGAQNGWVTVLCLDGQQRTYAGEEVEAPE